MNNQSKSKSYSVFLSHGSGDKYIVSRFIKPRIESVGARVFLDEGGIEYGEDFRKKIFAELVLSSEIVVFFTPTSINRPWVFAEVGASLIQDKRVIAIHYLPDEIELQKKGIFSLLGTTKVLPFDELDNYLAELKKRVEIYE